MVAVLEMDESRISFAETLRPPSGYELSFAVGTTYSLDLRALLGLCIPLGLGFDPEQLDNINPVSLFVSLKNLQGKLAIFCDKGNIKANIPSNRRSASLLMLLERMIHQVHVNPRRIDGLSSFHPKVWVLEYKGSAGDSVYRLVVMSRNLTFDTSWDVVVALDGRPGEQNKCAGHVADFLEFLAEGDAHTNTERDDTRKRGSHTARIRRLANDIRNVEFKVDNKAFIGVDFLPFGPTGDEARLMDAQNSLLMQGRWRNALVVSPFLSDGKASPLVRIRDNQSSQAGRFVLLSREDSLTKLDAAVRDAYEAYCPVPDLSDVELDGEDGADASGYSDLHAKLYFMEGFDNLRHLYLGSLNASYNGTVNNVEALLQMDVRPYQLTFAAMLKPLIGDGGKERAPFCPYVHAETDTQEDEGEKAFSRAFTIASKLVSFKSVVVRVQESDVISLGVELTTASCKKECDGLALTLQPLLATQCKEFKLASHQQTVSMQFDGLMPDQISGLFMLTGSDGEGHTKSCVLVCPHDRFDDASLSLESRSGILLQVITSADKGALAQYLAHAFNLPEAGYNLADQSEENAAAALYKYDVIPPGLYERLLQMAYADPSVFARASYLLSLLPKDAKQRDIEELRSMVGVFSKAVG